MTKIETLLDERVKLITKMRELNATAEEEKRDLNTEEKASYEKMKEDVISLKERADRLKEQEDLERELEESQDRSERQSVETRETDDETRDEKPVVERDEYRDAFIKYARTGNDAELRDLNLTTPADGGHTVPTELANQVIRVLSEETVVRSLPRTRILRTSNDRDIPIVDEVVGTWEPEGDPFANNSDTDPTFSQFQARAHKYTVGTKISDELLNDSAVDILALLAERFGQSFATQSDLKYVNGAGSGSNEPRGVLLDATVKQTGSQTSFTATELRKHFFALPKQYRRNSDWLINDSVIAEIAAISADNNNEFLFIPTLTEGEPDRLLGRPLHAHSGVDGTLQADAKIAVLGDFRYFAIIDRIGGTSMKRLNELFATSGQVGFIGYWRTDSGVLVADAFRTMQLAS